MTPLKLSKALSVPFSWRVVQEDSGTWIHLAGSVDLFSIRSFDQLLDDACGPEKAILVLECADLRYINSRGFASIYKHHNTVRAQQGRLIICGPCSKIHENLKMMGLDAVLDIVADRAGAEKLVKDHSLA